MYKMSFIPLLKNFVKEKKASFLLIVMLAFVNFIVTIIPSFLIQYYIDTLVVNKLINYVVILCCFITLMLILGEISKVLFVFLYSKIIFTLITNIKDSLMYRITHIKSKYVRKNKSKFLNIFTKDIDSIIDSGTEELPYMFFNLIVGLGAIIYISYVNIFMTIGIVLLTTLSLMPLLKINKKQSHLVKIAQTNEQEQSEFLVEVLNKPLFIKSLVSDRFLNSRFNEIMNDLLKSILKRELNFRIYLFTRIFFDGLIPAFIFFYGGYLFTQQSITVGEIVVCLSLIHLVTTPLNNISSYYLLVKDIVPRLNRIKDIFDVPLENNATTSKLNSIEGTSITFKDVVYKVDRNIILNNISFSINKGENMLIVGDSGSGKSTIFNLLLKDIEPTSGSISLNSINYEELAENDIRNIVSICHQDLFFLSGTIYENLVLDNPSLTQEEIEEAIYLSCMDEYLYKLESGLDTILTENAQNLSGGQRQRLAIARAILLKKEFLLLDETTSGLDEKLEQELFRRLIESNKITLINITHNQQIRHFFERIIDINSMVVIENY